MEDKQEKLPKPDWQNKNRKLRRITLAKKDCNNSVAWRIDRKKKIFIEINRNCDKVLRMILEMRTIYT